MWGSPHRRFLLGENVVYLTALLVTLIGQSSGGIWNLECFGMGSKEILSGMKFLAGDILRSSTGYFFATDPENLVLIETNSRFADWTKVRPIKRNSNVAQTIKAEKLPREPAANNFLEKGKAVADRLSGRVVYFNKNNCSAKHYAKYMAAGKTQVYGDCPLARDLSSVPLREVRSPDFLLHMSGGRPSNPSMYNLC